jgi:hypothetical protein
MYSLNILVIIILGWPTLARSDKERFNSNGWNGKNWGCRQQKSMERFDRSSERPIEAKKIKEIVFIYIKCISFASFISHGQNSTEGERILGIVDTIITMIAERHRSHVVRPPGFLNFDILACVRAYTTYLRVRSWRENDTWEGNEMPTAIRRFFRYRSRGPFSCVKNSLWLRNVLLKPSSSPRRYERTPTRPDGFWSISPAVPTGVGFAFIFYFPTVSSSIVPQQLWHVDAAMSVFADKHCVPPNKDSNAGRSFVVHQKNDSSIQPYQGTSAIPRLLQWRIVPKTVRTRKG